MNTPNREENTSRFNGLQKAAAALTGLGTVGYWLYDPQWLWNVAAWTASKANDILAWWWELANDGIAKAVEVVGTNLPIAEIAAPFAAPIISGGYLGKKVADVAGLEKRWQKIAASVVGAWVWGLFATSVAAPYITGVAAATALYRPFKWSLKKVGKAASSVYGWVAGVVGWAVKWALMWGYYGAKTNWSEGNVIPDVGFQRKGRSA